MSGPIKVRLHEGTEENQVPTRAYPGDAGFDLITSEDIRIGPGQVADIPCGFDIELPIGWWGLVVPRSSTWRRHEILVQQAVIDQGYRGPMFVIAHNPGPSWRAVKIGARIAQIVPLPLFPGLVRVVDELSGSIRGANGFGSSG